jgi:hypothetical protein
VLWTGYRNNLFAVLWFVNSLSPTYTYLYSVIPGTWNRTVRTNRKCILVPYIVYSAILQISNGVPCCLACCSGAHCDLLRTQLQQSIINDAAVIVHVTFEVFTAVTLKNAIIWDVTPCCSHKNRRFGRIYLLPSLPIVTLMMGAIGFSETSGLTRATRRDIPVDGIFLIIVQFLPKSQETQILMN